MFVSTSTGVVSCGGRITSPRASFIVHIVFYFFLTLKSEDIFHEITENSSKFYLVFSNHLLYKYFFDCNIGIQSRKKVFDFLLSPICIKYYVQKYV